jgi:hypothetical protein
MSTSQSPAVVKVLYQAIVPARVRGPLYSIRQLIKLLYQAILPATVRAPLYTLRRHILGVGATPAILPDSDSVSEPSPDLSTVADPCVVLGRTAEVPCSEPQIPVPEEYPTNVDGIPTASECLTPAVDSRPHQGFPERMMVGNPPREQLYL